MRVHCHGPEHAPAEISLKTFDEALELTDGQLCETDILEVDDGHPVLDMARDHVVLHNPVEEVERKVFQFLDRLVLPNPLLDIQHDDRLVPSLRPTANIARSRLQEIFKLRPLHLRLLNDVALIVLNCFVCFLVVGPSERL